MNEITKAGLMILGCLGVLVLVWLVGVVLETKRKIGKGMWF